MKTQEREVYGSDPFGYDIEQALEDAKTGPKSTIERVFDARPSGAPERIKGLPPVVGLFEGNHCRRCDAHFPALDAGVKREHGEWHEWRDENESHDDSSLAGDSPGFYERLRPPAGYEPDGRVITLEAPTAAGLEKHRAKFEPRLLQGSEEQRRVSRDARSKHREACDEIARMYGLAGDDLKRMIRELRAEGKSVPEISESAGVSEKAVKTLLGQGVNREAAAR